MEQTQGPDATFFPGHGGQHPGWHLWYLTKTRDVIGTARAFWAGQPRGVVSPAAFYFRSPRLFSGVAPYPWPRPNTPWAVPPGASGSHQCRSAASRSKCARPMAGLWDELLPLACALAAGF